jgi:hypothetical protein
LPKKDRLPKNSESCPKTPFCMRKHSRRILMNRCLLPIRSIPSHVNVAKTESLAVS